MRGLNPVSLTSGKGKCIFLPFSLTLFVLAFPPSASGQDLERPPLPEEILTLPKDASAPSSATSPPASELRHATPALKARIPLTKKPVTLPGCSRVRLVVKFADALRVRVPVCAPGTGS